MPRGSVIDIFARGLALCNPQLKLKSFCFTKYGKCNQNGGWQVLAFSRLPPNALDAGRQVDLEASFLAQKTPTCLSNHANSPGGVNY